MKNRTYCDGTEICLGDMVTNGGCIVYVERIFEPETILAAVYLVPNGGFMLSDLKYQSVGTVMSFDSYDLTAPQHDNGLNFKSRATLLFHFRYSWRELRTLFSYIISFRFWKKTWWRVCLFHSIVFIMSVGELFQAIIFGTGKNVRQLDHIPKEWHDLKEDDQDELEE